VQSYKFTERSVQRCWGGAQGFYSHHSDACHGMMNFAVFMPPGASADVPVPALYFLAGLTCTEETFVAKAGAQRMAAQAGLALVTCDTSPRHARFAGDDESSDVGIGAGFYLDATVEPWSAAYKMRTYVVQELRRTVEAHFAVRTDKRSIMGHSMGGHGALTIGLHHPELYQSVSAIAPIVAPSQVPWGQKAFARYLGAESALWTQYDACALLAQGLRHPQPLMVDQGSADKFLERELRPQLLQDACHAAGQKLQLRFHDGYDHSYYFIQTVIDDHLRFHASMLLRDSQD
jgi:S-formylglutathione hydrolase